ncbi:MAG: IS4 family transposase, partial [Spirochaetaceae bacterium]|nr:IS4 family transposase [Spirochaetaceae bacterium]
VIEDLFRTLKSEGVNYEASELESGKGLRKLFVLAFMTAIQILQLRQARDGQTEQKTSLVFSEEQAECLKDLLLKFEGKTEKQKNPWPPRNLAWASWVIGRLGGWKGYKSQRPPGVITLYEGLTRFHDIFQGWLLAKDVYKR